MVTDWRWNKSILIEADSKIGKRFVCGSYNIFGSNVTIGDGVNVGAFNFFESDTVIGPNVTIGSYNKIGSNAMIGSSVKIGSHNKIGSNAKLSDRVSIGDHSSIQGDQTIGMNSIISDFVYIAQKVNLGCGCFIDIRASLLDRYVFEKEEPCIISELVYIGANSVVMPGVMIGKGVVIGSNSLVEKNCFLSFCYYSGNPLRFQRNIIPKDSESAYTLKKSI